MRKILIVCVLTSLMINYATAQVAKFRSKADIQNELTQKYLDALFALNVDMNAEKAAVLLAEVVTADSTHSASQYYLSILIKNKEEAIKHAQKAVMFDPTNTWYQTRLTELYVQSGNYDKALEIAGKTLECDPKNTDSYTNIISILFGAKKFETALERIEDFESKFGASEEILGNRMRVYENMAPSNELVSKVLEYHKKNPTEPSPLLIVGEVYMKMGKMDSAIIYLKKAERLDSLNWRVIVSLSDYYLRTQDVENMFPYSKKVFQIRELELTAKVSFLQDVIFSPYFYKEHLLEVSDLVNTLVSVYPQNKEVNELLAQHFINSGMLDNAAEVYQNMIDKNVGDEETFYRIVGLRNYQKNYEEVIAVCDRMIEKYPESKISNTLQKSYALMEMKRQQEAITMLDAITSQTKDVQDLSTIYGMIGDIYHNWGKEKECYKAYNKSLKINPNNTAVLNNYSYYLSLSGKELNKALEMIKKVMSKEPDNATYVDTYGWILYQLGRYDEAVKILQDAVEKDTSESEAILMHYADALYKVGKTVNAKVYWRKAEKAGADINEIKKRMELK